MLYIYLTVSFHNRGSELGVELNCLKKEKDIDFIFCQVIQTNSFILKYKTKLGFIKSIFYN